MALVDNKIAAAEYTGKDIAGLADVPALTAAQLKARFDSLIKDLVAVKYNALIDELVTLVDTLATKDADGTENNFASLDADGNIQDSGKKTADFEAAGAVSTHNSAASPHTGKFTAAAHATATDNPHSVTAAQAAALPAAGGAISGAIISTVANGTGWNTATDGNITAIIPANDAIYSVLVGRSAAGTRYYGVDLYANYDYPSVRIYAGNKYMELYSVNGLNLSTPLTLANGGTGATDAAGARTALELGNSATLDTGTTAGTVATGNHGHTRSSLGFLSYQGEVSVAGSVNYVDVTIWGLTSSYRAFAFRAGVTGTTGNAVPVGAVCSTNNCRVYFSSNGAFSTTISIFATL